jgi:hypothetical protein
MRERKIPGYLQVVGTEKMNAEEGKGKRGEAKVRRTIPNMAKLPNKLAVNGKAVITPIQPHQFNFLLHFLLLHQYDRCL